MEFGKILGGVLIVAATAAIWLWPEAERAQTAAEPVRPVRSAVVRSSARMPDLRFVGTVKANESRTLTFKQSGRLQRVPVAKGQRLRKGEKIAWLDPQDFEDRLVQAEAAANRDRLTYQRMAKAAENNAVSKEEVSQAETRLKLAEAEYEIAKRALEETVLVAPFDCTVADAPADELTMVSPSTPIVIIQDLSKVKVDVVYPEALVIRAKKINNSATDCHCNLRISFDSMPDRSYPASFIEYTGQADKNTQTYLATYSLEPPEGLLILPGMSATLLVSGDSYSYNGEDAGERLLVPESAVGTDAQGGHFVWKLVESGEAGVWQTVRTPVVVNMSVGSSVAVSGGIRDGDRVATAGVSVLSEGRKVRLMGE